MQYERQSSIAPSSSVPQPLPTLQDERSKAFLKWVQSALSEEPTGSGPLVHAANREEWVTTISDLCRYILCTLPNPRGWQWNLLHEKVKVIELCLQVVQRAIRSTDSLFVGYDTHAKTLFSTLMALSNVLDQWCLTDVPQESEFLSPEELRAKAAKAAVEMLQSLGRGTQDGNSKMSSWVTLGVILDACISTCQSTQTFASISSTLTCKSIT